MSRPSDRNRTPARRRSPALVAALSCLASLVFGCFNPSSVRAEDWPRWRGPRGDGTWQAPRVPDRWPEQGLPVVWKAPIGPGYSGIAVADGRVFTMDRPKSPSDRERIVCLDADSGRQLWEVVYEARYGELDYPKGPRATPTIHDGRVYAIGSVGHVYCVDATDGRVVWKQDLVGQHQAKISTWGYSGSVVIDGDRAIVHAGMPNGCYAAFHRTTGELVWKSGDDPLGYGTPILIEHAGQRQLIGWTPEHIVGLAPDTGRIHWQVPYKVTYGVSIATPIFQQGLVVVCGYWEGSKAIRLGARPELAELAWEENRYLRGLMAQPLYRDGHVYLLDKQHGLVCFELATGKMVWTDKNQLTPRDRNPQANLVWLGDTDRVIALNASGELILARLSPQGYEEQGRTKIVGETWAHPAFAGTTALARDDEQLVCVRIAEQPAK